MESTEFNLKSGPRLPHAEKTQLMSEQNPSLHRTSTANERVAAVEKATAGLVAQENRAHAEFARTIRVNDKWDKLRAFRSLDLQDSSTNRDSFVEALIALGRSICEEGITKNVPKPRDEDTDPRAFALELLLLAIENHADAKKNCLAFLTRIISHSDGAMAIADLKDELRLEVLGIARRDQLVATEALLAPLVEKVQRKPGNWVEARTAMWNIVIGGHRNHAQKRLNELLVSGDAETPIRGTWQVRIESLSPSEFARLKNQNHSTA